MGPTHQSVRLTDGPHGHRLQPQPRVGGELTDEDAGHGEVGRGHGWTQRRVDVLVEVELVIGVAWFTGDEVTRRRCYGRRWFRPFPAATERGNKGKRIRELQGFQIERKGGRGRPVPRELQRAEAAELELDLELGWSWRRVEGTGGRFGGVRSEWW